MSYPTHFAQQGRPVEKTPLTFTQKKALQEIRNANDQGFEPSAAPINKDVWQALVRKGWAMCPGGFYTALQKPREFY